MKKIINYKISMSENMEILKPKLLQIKGKLRHVF